MPASALLHGCTCPNARYLLKFPRHPIGRAALMSAAEILGFVMRLARPWAVLLASMARVEGFGPGEGGLISAGFSASVWLAP